jgi:hypothetical protein
MEELLLAGHDVRSMPQGRLELSGGQKHRVAVARAPVRLGRGATGRVLGVVFCEALLVTGTSLVVATVVAILHADLMPASCVVAGVLLTAALVLAGTVVPAAAGLRRPAVELAG